MSNLEEWSTVTLQSTLQNITVPDGLTHPFAASDNTWSALSDVFTKTSSISDSLNAYLSFPLDNPRLTSLLRQHAAASHYLNLSEQNFQHTISSLKAQVGVSYGEDIPLDRNLIVDWCISRLEAWGSSVGMEAFKEEERQGKMTVVLGGKVLVMDVDFNIDRSDPSNPKLNIEGLKTSYASPSGGASTEGSVSMNGFLVDVLKDFLMEVQRPTEMQDPLKARDISRTFRSHLGYLMKLDHLASQEGDSGLRWFKSIDGLSLGAEGHAKLEANAITKSLSVSQAPLDIFLLRSHALPLPYLNSPSLSFLIHISPLAYLRFLRNSPSLSTIAPSNTLELDMPLPFIRSRLSVNPPPLGITTATLKICDVSKPRVTIKSDFVSDSLRPTLFLNHLMSQFEHVFPEPAESSINQAGSDSSTVCWILDFTHDGKIQGVVMSQSRMREIEAIVNPMSQAGNPTTMGIMGPPTFGGGSWVDLVLNPTNPVSPERYTSSYGSATSYPRLHLRLTTPQEPGFFLERVQVRNIKEVWSILEIVREQCWLNEILMGCKWDPEGFDSEKDRTDEIDSGHVDGDELQAVLTGTYQPRQIPINIYLPLDTRVPSLYNETRISQTPRIAMTLPERSPISGLVEISVCLDLTRPKGVTVSLNGAMSADLDVNMLEEVCRRGGVFSLPGRVWASSLL